MHRPALEVEKTPASRSGAISAQKPSMAQEKFEMAVRFPIVTVTIAIIIIRRQTVAASSMANLSGAHAYQTPREAPNNRKGDHTLHSS